MLPMVMPTTAPAVAALSVAYSPSSASPAALAKHIEAPRLVWLKGDMDMDLVSGCYNITLKCRPVLVAFRSVRTIRVQNVLGARNWIVLAHLRYPHFKNNYLDF